MTAKQYVDSPAQKKLIRSIAAELNLPRELAESVALATREWLAHFAIASARRGDVGRLEDVVIADALRWPGEPARIIAILCDCGIIDRDPEHRLVIRDWDRQAPSGIRKNIRRYGGFVAAEPSTPAQAAPASPPATATSPPSATPPAPELTDDWASARSRLAAAKSIYVDEIVFNAKRKGYTPQKVIELVAFWELRRAAWFGAHGVMRDRVAAAPPSSEANEKWPAYNGQNPAAIAAAQQLDQAEAQA